jgi:hypothetical protein
MDMIDIAREFAECLDRDDFVGAMGFISTSCEYRSGDRKFRGPDAIIASYREHAEFAKSHFETVVYESSVAKLTTDRFEVKYIDHITKNSKSHTYTCKQVLKFNSAGLITEIVHVEIPGERERLMTYFKDVGLR